jgi:hypothetical protein
MIKLKQDLRTRLSDLHKNQMDGAGWVCDKIKEEIKRCYANEITIDEPYFDTMLNVKVWFDCGSIQIVPQNIFSVLILHGIYTDAEEQKDSHYLPGIGTLVVDEHGSPYINYEEAKIIKGYYPSFRY